MNHIVHSIYKPCVKEGYTPQVMYTVSRNSCQMHLIGGKGVKYSLLSLHFPSRPKLPVPAYIILGIVGGEPDCGNNGVTWYSLTVVAMVVTWYSLIVVTMVSHDTA